MAWRTPRIVPLQLAATIAATATKAFFAQKWAGEVTAADFTLGTTIALDGTNNYTVTLQKGATVIATYNTGTTGTTANTPVAMTLSATRANRRVTSGDIIQVVATKAGTGANIVEGVVAVHLLDTFDHGTE